MSWITTDASRKVPGSIISDLGGFINDRVADGIYHIHVTEPADGSAVTWSSDQTFDFNSLGHGLVLSFDPECEIEYTGTGTALTISNSWGTTNTDKRLHFVGGTFSAPNDLDRLVQADDCYGTWFAPSQTNFSNSSGDAESLRIRNVNSYSEEAVIGYGHGRTRLETDRGVTLRDTGETGGSGTDSFHGFTAGNINWSGEGWGLRTAGIFEYGGIVNCTWQPTTSSAVGVQLDSTRTRGTGFINNKFESPPNPSPQPDAFGAGGDYDGFYNPTCFECFAGFGVNSTDISGIFIPNFRGGDFGLKLNYIGTGAGSYYEFRGNEFTIGSGNGDATLSVDSGGTLQVTDDRGTQDV